jgi:hypothetical protein
MNSASKEQTQAEYIRLIDLQLEDFLHDSTLTILQDISGYQMADVGNVTVKKWSVGLLTWI